MKTINPLIVLTALLTLSFACGGSDDRLEDNIVDEVVNTEPDKLYATVSMENGPGLLNEFLYGNCSPVSSEEWGPNHDFILCVVLCFTVH